MSTLIVYVTVFVIGLAWLVACFEGWRLAAGWLGSRLPDSPAGTLVGLSTVPLAVLICLAGVIGFPVLIDAV